MTFAMYIFVLSIFFCGALLALRFSVRILVLSIMILLGLATCAAVARLMTLPEALGLFLLSSVAAQLGYFAVLLCKAFLAGRSGTPNVPSRPARRSN
jgi:hypothetical protein